MQNVVETSEGLWTTAASENEEEVYLGALRM